MKISTTTSHDLEFGQFELLVTRKANIHTVKDNREFAFTLLSHYIKKNRCVLLGSFAPYAIINSGDGIFKKVKVNHPDGKITYIPAKQILDTLRDMDSLGKLDTHL